MELPDEIFAFIGEFMLSFPKLDMNKQREAKDNLARNIVVLYPEYVDYIAENYKIPDFDDFKKRCKHIVAEYRNATDKIIKQKRLEEYRDIIMENYTLSIPKLLNIAGLCYNQKKDLSVDCRLYCKLGYSGFEYRNGNEGYLINFMRNWVEFSTRRGDNKEAAQYDLLSAFTEMDEDAVFDVQERKGIWSFFPFTKENVDGLVDFVMKFDDFDSDEYKKMIENNYSDEDIDTESHSFLKGSLLHNQDDRPRSSLLCNYYVYIFNKLNDTYPLSAFAVSVFYKWLQLNRTTISLYLSELPASVLYSLLQDFAIHKYANATIVYEEANPLQSLFKSSQDDDIIELLYKLHYQTEISKSELADLWVYIVINKKLSYINQRLKETAPIMLVSEGEYAENGEFMLPWKYVRFVDGKAFFYHPNHERGKGATLPFKLEHDKIQATFMNIGKTILWNFPFIPCEAEQGRIVRIDESFAISVIWDLVNIHEKLSRWKSIPHSTSLTAHGETGAYWDSMKPGKFCKIRLFGSKMHR